MSKNHEEKKIDGLEVPKAEAPKTETPKAEAAKAPKALTLLKKITAKSLGLDFEKHARIYGCAKGFITGSSEYGDFAKYQGSFFADVLDKEDNVLGTFRAGTLILPSVADTLIQPSIEEGEHREQETGEVFEGILFSLLLSKAEKPKRTPIDCGYEWRVEVQGQHTDNVDMLQKVQETLQLA